MDNEQSPRVLDDVNPVARDPANKHLPARTIWLMAISVGVIVANSYYIQPLLSDIARDFSLTTASAGLIAMLMQIGTAFGMLFFVPLGDTHERRSLVSILLLAAAASLIVFATARNIVWLGIGAAAVGMLTATVHVIVPFAAHLAAPVERGLVLGFVFSGLLFGILLARTFSGFVGAQFGWRSVFWVAAGAMLVLTALVRWLLPLSTPEVYLSWMQLIRSAAGLIRQHPALRESAMVGALFFAAFSAFWTTLIFRLQSSPFHYGSRVAGLFGLVGAAGAAGAPLVGYFADKRGPRMAVLLALLTAVAAFIILGIWGDSIVGLIGGVLVLDLAVQSGHVANQTRIYSLDPHARSRLNMVYMVCYFVGGAAGSYFGALAWHAAGWWGVCSFAITSLVTGIVVLCRAYLSTIRKLD